MKKTKLTRSLLAACSIVALSAVMYGCSSGPSQDEYDAAKAATAEAEAEAKASADAAAVAVAAKATADTAAAAAAEAKATAEAAADKARLAQEAAETQSALDAQAKIDADAAAAKADEDARIAQEAADAAQMVADAAIKAQMDAEAERDDAQMALEDNQQETQDAATLAHLRKLVRLHTGLSNPDTGNVEEGDHGAPAISATHGMPAGSGAAPKVGTTTGAADEINGFSGTQLDWMDDDYMHTITVYTDIDETTGVPIGQKYDLANGFLELVETPNVTERGQVAFTGEEIESDDFVKVNDRTHSFNADGPDADSDPDHVAFVGTYDGAEGVYRCSTVDGTDSACTSMRNSSDVLTLSAGWTFTPDSGAMVQVTDGIYTYFGWWLRENLDAPPNTRGLSAQTFAGVNGGTEEDPTVSSAIVGLIGTAKFAGGAAGKFAVYDAVVNQVDGGHFTADANLTADFDTEIISGMIDNFMFGDRTPNEPWSVALMATNMETDVGADATENEGLHFTTVDDTEFDHDGDSTTDGLMQVGAGTQWSIGGRKEDAAGNWGGTFHDTGRNDSTPGYAVGEFSAEFGTVGRMLGAFGTDNVTPDRDAQ